MTWAAATRPSQIIERRHFLTTFDQTARTRDDCGVLARDGNAIRVAALARSTASGLGRVKRVVQVDVRWIRLARCTRRQAVNSSRHHRVPEERVGGAVAGDDARPAGIIYDRGRRDGFLHFGHGHVSSSRNVWSGYDDERTSTQHPDPCFQIRMPT